MKLWLFKKIGIVLVLFFIFQWWQRVLMNTLSWKISVSISIFYGDLVSKYALLGFFQINLLSLAELVFVKHWIAWYAIVRHCTPWIVRKRYIALSIIDICPNGLEIIMIVTDMKKICPTSCLSVSFCPSLPCLRICNNRRRYTNTLAIVVNWT